MPPPARRRSTSPVRRRRATAATAARTASGSGGGDGEQLGRRRPRSPALGAAPSTPSRPTSGGLPAARRPDGDDDDRPRPTSGARRRPARPGPARLTCDRRGCRATPRHLASATPRQGLDGRGDRAGVDVERAGAACRRRPRRPPRRPPTAARRRRRRPGRGRRRAAACGSAARRRRRRRRRQRRRRAGAAGGGPRRAGRRRGGRACAGRGRRRGRARRRLVGGRRRRAGSAPAPTVRGGRAPAVRGPARSTATSLNPRPLLEGCRRSRRARSRACSSTPKRVGDPAAHLGHQGADVVGRPPASAWMKLACLVDTSAVPIRRPLHPAASMSRPAESPGGLVNTDPAFGPPGWLLAPPAHDLGELGARRGPVAGRERERGVDHDAASARRFERR